MNRISIASLGILALLAVRAEAVPIVLDDSVRCGAGNALSGIAIGDVTGDAGGATECFGTFDGNDPGPAGDGFEIFGMLFDFIAKEDTPGGLAGMDIGLIVSPDGGALSGTWEYDPSLFSADSFLIVLKAGNSPGFGVWLFDGMDASSFSGDWSVAWGKDYYQFGDTDENSGTDLDALEDGGFFSFDIKDKVIVTSTEEQMKALLDRNGKLAGMGNHSNAMFVLTADKSLVQAGLRTNELDDDDGWDSNILRNTEQLALLIADSDGLIAIEAHLVTSKPGLAKSIGSIVNGLIALQAFNDDLPPEIVSLIQNTKIEVKDSTLSINTVIDPAHIIAILED